jgi:mannose/fructose-specific phosphotransferase system component IIA
MRVCVSVCMYLCLSLLFAFVPLQRGMERHSMCTKCTTPHKHTQINTHTQTLVLVDTLGASAAVAAAAAAAAPVLWQEGGRSV